MRKKKKNSKIVMVDERKKKSTGYSKKKSKAKTAQDTIPFDEIYENGLFRSEETFTIIFQLENLPAAEHPSERLRPPDDGALPA